MSASRYFKSVTFLKHHGICHTSCCKDQFYSLVNRITSKSLADFIVDEVTNDVTIMLIRWDIDHWHEWLEQISYNMEVSTSDKEDYITSVTVLLNGVVVIVVADDETAESVSKAMRDECRNITHFKTQARGFIHPMSHLTQHTMENFIPQLYDDSRISVLNKAYYERRLTDKEYELLKSVFQTITLFDLIKMS